MAGYEVQKAEAKETTSGELETHNYVGDHPLGSPEDSGAERHGHIVVDESGEVDRARDVGEKKMGSY